MIAFLKKHPVGVGVVLVAIPAVSAALFIFLVQIITLANATAQNYMAHDLLTGISEPIASVLIIVCFGIYPVFLTVVNIIGAFKRPSDAAARKLFAAFALATVIIGAVYSCFWALFTDFMFLSEWSEQLYNNQVHQPIWTQGLPTVVALSLCGVAGYVVLTFVRLEKLPPLVVVISMAGMYLGIAECVLWIIQLMGGPDGIRSGALPLVLLPLNCVFIAVATVRHKVLEWREVAPIQHAVSEVALHSEVPYRTRKPWMNRLDAFLQNSSAWPLAAFVCMWPLLGVLLAVLALFGQEPDKLARAWTETADWTLSQQTGPPNLFYDEHYLCTVAACGHRQVVKPLRKGVRHGHEVVVNRQLCIANAFEQVLEERTPRFHRRVRRFYDTYGFPIARLIQTKVASDVVYVLMKPAEWIFLAVIYLCDAKPENRISTQYLPK